MRVVLGACREQGESFTVAWKRAIGSLPRSFPDRQQVLAELREYRTVWRDAYEGGDELGFPISEAVLAFVAARLGLSAPDEAEDPVEDAERPNAAA